MERFGTHVIEDLLSQSIDSSLIKRNIDSRKLDLSAPSFPSIPLGSDEKETADGEGFSNCFSADIGTIALLQNLLLRTSSRRRME